MSGQQLEASLEEFFRKRIRLVGGWSVKLAPTEAGIPDRLVVFPSHHPKSTTPGIFLVELKTVSGYVSPIQLQTHAKLRDMGVQVVVLFGREQIVEWIRCQVDFATPW